MTLKAYQEPMTDDQASQLGENSSNLAPEPRPPLTPSRTSPNVFRSTSTSSGELPQTRHSTHLLRKRKRSHGSASQHTPRKSKVVKHGGLSDDESTASHLSTQSRPESENRPSANTSQSRRSQASSKPLPNSAQSGYQNRTLSKSLEEPPAESLQQNSEDVARGADLARATDDTREADDESETDDENVADEAREVYKSHSVASSGSAVQVSAPTGDDGVNVENGNETNTGRLMEDGSSASTPSNEEHSRLLDQAKELLHSGRETNLGAQFSMDPVAGHMIEKMRLPTLYVEVKAEGKEEGKKWGKAKKKKKSVYQGNSRRYFLTLKDSHRSLKPLVDSDGPSSASAASAAAAPGDAAQPAAGSSTTTAPAAATDSEPLGIAPALTEGEYEAVVETSGTPFKVENIDMASEIAIQLPIDVPVAKIKGAFRTPQELVSHLARNYYLKVDASGKTVTNRFILKPISGTDKWELLLDEQ